MRAGAASSGRSERRMGAIRPSTVPHGIAHRIPDFALSDEKNASARLCRQDVDFVSQAD